MTEALRRVLGVIRRYPTMVGSLFIILALIGISIYAMITIPLSEAVALWNGGDEVWRDTPRYAQPAWTNLFRREKLPETFVVRMDDAASTKETLGETRWRETTVLTFDYEFSRFPDEISFFLDVEYDTQRPLVTLTWIKPDGTEIEFFRGNPQRSQRVRISRDIGLSGALGKSRQAEPDADPGSPDGDGEQGVMRGQYALRVEALSFEEGLSMSGRLVVLGGVYGIAGTDDLRRDLAIGLLWGTPIALMFGLLATIGTTALGFIIAAFGAWFGGWVDAAIQRITEVNMMLPFLPIVLVIGKFFSSSLWVLLGVIIALNIFSGALKSYRAMFLQVKDAPYIEAARAYGASNVRIIFRYLIPKIIPVLIPSFVLGVRQFVFLEASLAVLGVGDPTLPTWGKILSEGLGALYLGHYHCVLEPAVLLLITGLSFSMLGYALDRVFNPRLRGF